MVAVTYDIVKIKQNPFAQRTIYKHLDINTAYNSLQLKCILNLKCLFTLFYSLFANLVKLLPVAFGYIMAADSIFSFAKCYSGQFSC